MDHQRHAQREVGVNDPSHPCTRPAGQWNDVDGQPINVYEADLGVELPGRVGGVLPSIKLCGGRCHSTLNSQRRQAVLDRRVFANLKTPGCGHPVLKKAF